MNEKIVKKNIKDMSPKHKREHKDYEFNKYEITDRKDFNQCYICIYELEPNKSAYPKHYHSNNTECFYIIDGQGIIETNDEILEVMKGDTIVFPCGTAGTHKITNNSKDILRYIDFDTTNSPDIVHYIDSNKIGIIEHNKSSIFYRNEDNVDYYDGE